MSRHGKDTRTSRKRAVSRLQKLRGSLKGKPSALDFLLNERQNHLRTKSVA